MKNVKTLALLTGVVLLSVFLINAVQSSGAPPPVKERAEANKAVNNYNVYAVELPSELNFAGEKVPLQDPDIRERTDREFLVNTYWQSNGFLMIKRAHKYFPVIEPILKKNGIPDDFKYLAVIESGLQNVVSPAKATGFWQIAEGTGKEYGMEINDNVDERYHIEKSTEVACAYLKDAKKRLGSWTLAAAGYNAGMYGIEKRLKEQKVKSYYDLLFGQETGRYIFRILALKEILTDPGKYGFNLQEKDLYKRVPAYEVEVDTAVSDFADFAKTFHINYKILKIHNPWLRESHLKNTSRKKYRIKIPEKGYYQSSK